MTAKRYALIGTGGRGLGMFAGPLSRDFPETAELVALCDPNPIRVAYAATKIGKPVAQYTDFARLMRECDPDALVVASRDCTHAEYVIAGLKAGKRVISEKPLCTTAAQCRAILKAADASRGRCFVTHNMRYGAASALIHSIIRSGRIGRVRFMQFDETLDLCHGADYFRRWHRHLANSGGLLIHKASHHFDTLNWWADSIPVRVSAQGSLKYYGRNGPFRHPRCHGCPHARKCARYVDLFARPEYKAMYLDAESADGYRRDGCVFDRTIDICDQMGVLIRYANGIEVSYTLTAYSPYESQRTVIEGTAGRIEYFARHNTGWALGKQLLPGVENIGMEQLRLFVPGRGIEDVAVERKAGSHGGADPSLRQDFFGRDWRLKPTEQMAPLDQAVQAVLIGHAANRSIATGQSVDVPGLLKRG